MTHTTHLTICAAKHGGLCVWDSPDSDPVFAGDLAQFQKYIGERANELLKAVAAENNDPQPVIRVKAARESREIRNKLLELEAAE